MAQAYAPLDEQATGGDAWVDWCRPTAGVMHESPSLDNAHWKHRGRALTRCSDAGESPVTCLCPRQHRVGRAPIVTEE